MNNEARLELGGLCSKPLALRHAELARLPADAQVADVAALVPGRAGRAVKLAALRVLAGEEPGVAFLDVASADNQIPKMFLSPMGTSDIPTTPPMLDGSRVIHHSASG